MAGVVDYQEVTTMGTIMFMHEACDRCVELVLRHASIVEDRYLGIVSKTTPQKFIQFLHLEQR